MLLKNRNTKFIFQNLLKKKWVGFTLIELLVIVTIIGILAAIVGLEVRNWVGRARDERAKTNMNQIRIEAAKIYQDYGKYDDTIFCCEGSNCKKEVKINCSEIENQVGAKPTINAAGNQYCAYVLLNNGLYFCIDSTGVAGEFSSVSNCTNTSYSCK